MRSSGGDCGASSRTIKGSCRSTVKWFDMTKGFGFLQSDQGGDDVFIHISAMERAGLRDVQEGEIVSFAVAFTFP